MNNIIDIDVEINDRFIDPKVIIKTRAKNALVDSIVDAVENISENEYPVILGQNDGKAEFVSQRDIIRIYFDDRKSYIETDDKILYSKKPLKSIDESLNSDRFVRISKSEIINIYKVKHFEFSIAGTIGVELENGVNTWVARSRIKGIKDMINRNETYNFN